MTVKEVIEGYIIEPIILVYLVIGAYIVRDKKCKRALYFLVFEY